MGLRYEPALVRPLYAPGTGGSGVVRARRELKRVLVTRELRKASRRRPFLSSDADLARAEHRLDTALDCLRSDVERGTYLGRRGPSDAGAGSRRAGGD